MLRPKRLEWEDVDDFLIASNPLGGMNYFVSKSTTNAMIGRQYLGKGVSVYLAKELCQSHYDAAWLAGGEEVAEWQPIGTGPENGVVLGCVAGGKESFEMIYSKRNGWLCYGCPCDPTHWMPLPKPME